MVVLLTVECLTVTVSEPVSAGDGYSVGTEAVALAQTAAAVAARPHVYADVLRALAAVAVVGIHVSGQGVAHPEAVSRSSFWADNMLDAGFRWSVPVFVMVSGALLMGSPREETIGSFYRRRVSRVGIPLVFWSVTYLLWRHYYVGEAMPWTVVRQSLVTGMPSFHLYFLFIITGLYAVTPLFKPFVRRASMAELWTVTLLVLGMASGTHVIRLTTPGLWSQGTALDWYLPYIGYFLAGYAIACGPRPSARWERVWRMAAWVGVPVAWWLTVRQVGRAPRTPQGIGRAVELYYQYLAPGVVVMSLGVFAIVADLYREPGAVGRVRRRVAGVCRWVAPAAFGVYLIHPMLLWEVFKHHGMPTRPHAAVAAPAWTAALFLGSLAATKLIQLVPGLRRVVG